MISGHGFGQTNATTDKRKTLLKRRHVIIVLSTAVLAAIMAAVAWPRHNRSDSVQEALAMLEDGQRKFNNDSMLASFGKLQEAVTAFRELNDSDRLFESIVYLSMVYDQIGQKKEAYSTLKTMGFRDVGNYEAYSSQYYLRMMAYYSALLDKDYSKSENYTKMAVDFSRRKYPADKSKAYIDIANLAELYIMGDKHGQAWQIVNEIAAYDSTDNQLYRSELHYCRGLLYDYEGLADSAYTEYNRSLAYSRRYNAIDNELNALTMLLRADSAAGRLLPYIHHRQTLDSLKARQNGNEMYYRLAMLKEQHKTEMMIQESEKDRTKHQLSLCLLMFVILLMAAGFTLIYKSIKAKQKLAAAEKDRLDATIEMEKMEKELLQLKIENRDRMLNRAHRENLAMSLKLAEAGKESEPTRLVPLVHTLNEMDNDFIKKLEEAYPMLSKNDVRLISMIRTGMSSTEIASVLNISTESLNKSKYRLRKKLNLQNGLNIETFIKTFE